MPKLTGRRIVLTGASRGVGYETVKLFSVEGAEIIGVARDATKLNALGRPGTSRRSARRGRHGLDHRCGAGPRRQRLLGAGEAVVALDRGIDRAAAERVVVGVEKGHRRVAVAQRHEGELRDPALARGGAAVHRDTRGAEAARRGYRLRRRLCCVLVAQLTRPAINVSAPIV